MRFKRILSIAGIVVAAIVKLLIISLVAFLAFFDSVAPLSYTPLGEYPSENGKHICYIYVSDGGVLSPWTVIAEVRGTWIIGRRPIYSVKHLNEAAVIWLITARFGSTVLSWISIMITTIAASSAYTGRSPALDVISNTQCHK